MSPKRRNLLSLNLSLRLIIIIIIIIMIIIMIDTYIAQYPLIAQSAVQYCGKNYRKYTVKNYYRYNKID